MKIGITPSVRETYKNQFEYSVDIKLINFLKFCFINSKIFIINDTSLNIKNIDFLILSGGNDIYNLVKCTKNFIRNRLDYKVLNNAIKKKIPVLGICYGAQFISNFFNNEVFKKKGHINKNNEIKIINKDYSNKSLIKIKCFHNYVIKSHKKFDPIGVSEDKTIEFFKIKNKKIYGMMWHPERNLNLKKFNKAIIKKICS